MYECEKGETESGEASTIGEVTDESFWKPRWSRHKNPPKWIVDYSDSGVVVVGYKTRRGENTTATEVVRTLVPDVKPQEIKRLRGDVMVFRRIPSVESTTAHGESGTEADVVVGVEVNHREVEESKEDERAVPASLRMEKTLPLEYLVRCEGASDDNVNLVSLLEREGIMCGPDGEDTPGPLSFAKVRNVAREKLWAILGDPEMTRETERGILEETIRQAYTHNLPRIWKNKVVKEIYKTLYAKVWRNLLPADHPQSVGNPKLLSHIKSGLIDAKSLASMSPQKMWPEKWRDLEEARILKQIATLERSVTASTDMFTCGRCGKNECTYREVQTRSADEPMTAFVLCLVCGNRWKE